MVKFPMNSSIRYLLQKYCCGISVIVLNLYSDSSNGCSAFHVAKSLLYWLGSNFGDIFDVNHFINSLRNEVRIVKKLPFKFRENFVADDIMSIPPVSWSNESYYMNQVFSTWIYYFCLLLVHFHCLAKWCAHSALLNQILPLIKKQKIIRFSKTDTRLANNGLPLEMQILRCKVNFEALKFTNHIEELGKKVVKYLQAKGTFLVLHLRYEMDMLAFLVARMDALMQKLIV